MSILSHPRYSSASLSIQDKNIQQIPLSHRTKVTFDLDNQSNQDDMIPLPPIPIENNNIDSMTYYSDVSISTIDDTQNIQIDENLRINNDIPTDNINDMTDERGDLMIRGFWRRATDCIIDVMVTDLDSTSYLNSNPQQILQIFERSKKSKYLKKCLEQRRDFTPFICSTDGVLGKEAKAL